MTTCLQRLTQQIRSNGTLSFSEFMHTALYDPRYGYYAQLASRQGVEGDYLTAPTLGPLFAHTLAPFLAQQLTAHPDWGIIEIGPGSGDLACSLLHALDALACHPAHYTLVEPLAVPRQRLQKKLAQLPDSWQSRIRLQAHLPKQAKAIVLANEVLDALPVDLLLTDDEGHLYEQRVGLRQDMLTFLDTAPNSALSSCLTSRNIPLYPNYRYEINRSAPLFFADLTSCLAEGWAFFFDYGYARKDYYHPTRNHGTLTCFSEHQSHDDPLQNPGQTDISVHVDFTYMAELASQLEWRVGGFFQQADFLMALGIAEVTQRLANQGDGFHAATLSGQLKTLLHPTQMGGSMQVLALSPSPLSLPNPLQAIDQAHRL